MKLSRRTLLAHAATLPLAWRAQAATAIVADEDWHDAARNRTLPMRMRWPATPGPWPLALFSHGLGGSRDGGAAWGEAWADAGFVVVHLQHPGSDTPALRAGGREGLAQAASAQQLVQRAADVHYVLDEVGRRHAAGAGRWRDVRTDRIGMSGHSFGAHTTFAIAGQRYPGGASLADRRPAAFIAFSPTLPRSADPREALAGVSRPLLCLTGTRDEDVIGTGATPERRAAVYDALPAGAKAMLLLQDADHMTFGGQPGRTLALRRRGEAPRQLEARHTELIARLTADWWRAQLLGDAAARERLGAPAGLASGDRWVQG
jgi:predicted dienelactone hydrolase